MGPEPSYGPAYAGIGSYKAPEDILKNMTLIAKSLVCEGYAILYCQTRGYDHAFKELSFAHSSAHN